MSNFDGGVEFKASDYKKQSMFTGIVDATPVKFNPTKAEIAEIRGWDVSKLRDTNYKSENNDGIKQTRLELLMKINPNEVINKRDEAGELVSEYYDDHFFTASFYMSKEHVVSKSGKFQFINHRLQTAWADSEKTLSEYTWFSKEGVRKLRVGEESLYNLVYALFKKTSTKKDPIKKFTIGTDPVETFEEIVDGDFSILNEYLDPSSDVYAHFSHDDGTIRKISVLLGVEPSDKADKDGNPYLNQRVFVNAFVNTFNKEGRDLSTKAKEAIEEGRFKATIQDSYEFKPYDDTVVSNKRTEPSTSIEAPTVDDDLIPGGLPF